MCDDELRGTWDELNQVHRSGIPVKATLTGAMLAGFQAAVSIVPGSIAVLSGVKKGLTTYTQLSRKAAITRDHHDEMALAKFHSVVICTCQSVFILPFLLVVIFLFQSFTNYMFLLTIIGAYVLLLGCIYWALKEGNLTQVQPFSQSPGFLPDPSQASIPLLPLSDPLRVTWTPLTLRFRTASWALTTGCSARRAERSRGWRGGALC
eukprot:1179905-Rhodomonas_salina.2